MLETNASCLTATIVLPCRRHRCALRLNPLLLYFALVVVHFISLIPCRCYPSSENHRRPPSNNHPALSIHFMIPNGQIWPNQCPIYLNLARSGLSLPPPLFPSLPREGGPSRIAVAVVSAAKTVDVREGSDQEHWHTRKGLVYMLLVERSILSLVGQERKAQYLSGSMESSQNLKMKIRDTKSSPYVNEFNRGTSGMQHYVGLHPMFDVEVMNEDVRMVFGDLDSWFGWSYYNGLTALDKAGLDIFCCVMVWIVFWTGFIWSNINEIDVFLAFMICIL